MQVSENAKLAISVASGAVAMSLAYLVFLRKRSYSADITITDEEPWPMSGTIEEKEALIDAILEEPSMLEAMKDPTRNARLMNDR